MKGEGFWLNWMTGIAICISDHEQDIRIPALAKKLGVPDEVFLKFKRYRVIQDRIKFLRWVVRQVPLVRIRDHIEHITCEYAAKSDKKPYAAIKKVWAGRCGPATLLMLVNIQTQRHLTVPAQLFMEGTKV
jgi:hypothetical protein